MHIQDKQNIAPGKAKRHACPGASASHKHFSPASLPNPLPPLPPSILQRRPSVPRASELPRESLINEDPDIQQCVTTARLVHSSRTETMPDVPLLWSRRLLVGSQAGVSSIRRPGIREAAQAISKPPAAHHPSSAPPLAPSSPPRLAPHSGLFSPSRPPHPPPHRTTGATRPLRPKTKLASPTPPSPPHASCYCAPPALRLPQQGRAHEQRPRLCRRGRPEPSWPGVAPPPPAPSESSPPRASAHSEPSSSSRPSRRAGPPSLRPITKLRTPTRPRSSPPRAACSTPLLVLLREPRRRGAPREAARPFSARPPTARPD